MLYEIIISILALCVAAIPFWTIWCIRFGYHMATEPEKEMKKHAKRKKNNGKELKLSKEEEEERAYWNNVINYDGTSKGQRLIGE